LGIGDWGLGIGGPIPNPPIPNPQSPIKDKFPRSPFLIIRIYINLF
jgi:hypothetical protein